MENNPQSPDGEILKATFQHMTPVQDIYILQKKKNPQHTLVQYVMWLCSLLFLCGCECVFV